MKKQIGILAASVLSLAAIAPAQKANNPVPGKIQISETDRSATAAYWTTDRLAAAKPMPLPEVDPLAQPRNADVAAPVTTGPRGVVPGGAPTFTLSKDAQQPFEAVKPIGAAGDTAASTGILPQGFNYEMPFSNHRSPVGNGYPYSAVGKLFFFIPPGASEPSGEYVCSASVDMNSHTVITARHCMYDYSTGVWYNNWVFYPAYSNGGNPAYHGGWTVRKLATWVSNASTWDYDIGFMQLNDDRGYGCGGSSGGRPVGSYTGWFGATWNGDYSQRQWDIFGYPAAPPFGGAYLWEDEAATGVLNPFGATNIVEVGNPQTGGTSGGPWIIGLDPFNLAIQGPGNNTYPLSNLVNGLNSFKWTIPNHPYSINGPAFYTYNFVNLFSYYSGLSCP